MLRDYQQKAIDSFLDAFKRNVKRPAFVLATGGGKTVVFSSLIPQIPKSDPDRGDKVLVLAHTEELIKQASTTIKRLNPKLKVEVDMRSSKPSPKADVIVGSVQTLVRASRLEQYDPDDFKAIILDECHHATANSWLKILKYFDADHADLNIYVIGCTATMERSDNQSLGKVFDEIVFERGLLTMIENKELVDVKFTSLKADLDLSKVTSYKNDYAISSLSKAVNDSNANLVVVAAYKRLREQNDFKSTIMFCVDINHCKTLCGILQREGINAQYVTGETVKHLRSQIIEDFKNGIVDVLCNVQVFTEGTDMPNIDSIFLVRPTKSRPLLVQMIGRGLRLNKGKSVCHVADIAGTRGTGIQSVPTLFSLPSDFPIEGKSYKQIEEEKQKYLEDKKQESINKELQRRLEEELSHEKLAKFEQDLVLNFTTIDGFNALEAKDIEDFKDSTNIHKALDESSLTWVRLEYDVWAVQVDERFFLLKRVDYHMKNLFELSASGFIPGYVKLMANFKVSRTTKEEFIMSDYNLTSVIRKAEKLIQDIGPPRFGYHDKKSITEKQILYLDSKMTSVIKKYYDVTPELEQQFLESLKTFTRARATHMIFALKYSVNSLHLKWELQKMLGPNKKVTKTIKKIVSRETKDKDFLKNDLNNSHTAVF